jgi:hypothetical protein
VPPSAPVRAAKRAGTGWKGGVAGRRDAPDRETKPKATKTEPLAKRKKGSRGKGVQLVAKIWAAVSYWCSTQYLLTYRVILGQVMLPRGA